MPVIWTSGGPLAVPLADLKDYLRITRNDEDAGLERLIRAATELAEGFTGQVIMRRGAEEICYADSAWRALGARPVSAITLVRGIPADGAEFDLPVDAYAIEIAPDGTGWVRIINPGAAGRVRVFYEAGLATDATDVPPGIAQGILRLAAEYHAEREGDTDRVPASVLALWRPWRRMRIA